jgi:hypothetical protein
MECKIKYLPSKLKADILLFLGCSPRPQPCIGVSPFRPSPQCQILLSFRTFKEEQGETLIFEKYLLYFLYLLCTFFPCFSREAGNIAEEYVETVRILSSSPPVSLSS